MEENKNSNLDSFVKRLVDEAGLEEPSADFTNTVLSRIQRASEKNNVFVYKPLISKKIWLLLGVSVSALFGYLVFGNSHMETGLPYLFELNKLAAFNLSVKMPDLPVSDTFVYGFLALAFFVGIQVMLLTKRVNKSYQLR